MTTKFRVQFECNQVLGPRDLGLPAGTDDIVRVVNEVDKRLKAAGFRARVNVQVLYAKKRRGP